MNYLFQREDNGEVIEVDFATMMTMDVAGFITLEDGVQAKRLPQGSVRIKGEVLKGKPDGVHVSDSLGFCEHQLEYFEQDRIKHGFTGVEFVRDPLVPQFFQVKTSSEAVKQRYAQHRGMADHNSRNGSKVVISEEQLQTAKQWAVEKYGPPKRVEHRSKTVLDRIKKDIVN